MYIERLEKGGFVSAPFFPQFFTGQLQKGTPSWSYISRGSWVRVPPGAPIFYPDLRLKRVELREIDNP